MLTPGKFIIFPFFLKESFSSYFLFIVRLIGMPKHPIGCLHGSILFSLFFWWICVYANVFIHAIELAMITHHRYIHEMRITSRSFDAFIFFFSFFNVMITCSENPLIYDPWAGSSGRKFIAELKTKHSYVCVCVCYRKSVNLNTVMNVYYRIWYITNTIVTHFFLLFFLSHLLCWFFFHFVVLR